MLLDSPEAGPGDGGHVGHDRLGQGNLLEGGVAALLIPKVRCVDIWIRLFIYADV